MEDYGLKFNEQGLIPAVAQDLVTGQVLMLAYMNKEAIDKTIETGYAHYYSRSRQCLWKKGETSGNLQKVDKLFVDCDLDAIVLKINQSGPACHTGNQTCFYRELAVDGEIKNSVEPERMGDILTRLYELVLNRKDQPLAGSYTNYLFDKGIDKILKKVGEESAEVIIAGKNHSKVELTYEVSDLLYHLIVLLVEEGVKFEDIFIELEKRHHKK